MSDPTPEVIIHALTAARAVVKRNRHMSLATALAHATTAEQCRGYQGFKVYRDVRAAVAKSHGLDAVKAAEFTETTFDIQAVDALDKAIKELS